MRFHVYRVSGGKAYVSFIEAGNGLVWVPLKDLQLR